MVPVNLLGFFVFLPPLIHGGCEFLFRDFAVTILISSGSGVGPQPLSEVTKNICQDSELDE